MLGTDRIIDVRKTEPEALAVSGAYRADGLTEIDYVFRTGKVIEVVGAKAGEKVVLACQYLPERLEKESDERHKYSASIWLSDLTRLEKRPVSEAIAHLSMAHRFKPSGKAATRFQTFYGAWFADYVRVLLQEGENLQQEMEALFDGNGDFLYALALDLELKKNYKLAIQLYGCSAEMGNKKSLYALYNMAKTNTNYFRLSEAQL